MNLKTTLTAVLACAAFALWQPAAAKADGILYTQTFANFPFQSFSEFAGNPTLQQNSITAGSVAVGNESATALQAGTELKVSAASDEIGSAGASTVLEDAGIVHVAGGGTTQIQLLDEVSSLARAGSGTVGGKFLISAEWGPYSPSTGVVEVTNEYDQNYFWDTYWEGTSYACQAKSSSSPGTYSNTFCPALNSITGVTLPIVIGDGDALLIFLQAEASSTGDASLAIADPLTVNLPPGTSFTDSVLPVSYSGAPSPVPEPPTLWLLAAGLLPLAWALRRRGSRLSELETEEV